jgi:hypothetical protein
VTDEENWFVIDLNDNPSQDPAFGPMSEETARFMVKTGEAAPLPRRLAAIRGWQMIWRD